MAGSAAERGIVAKNVRRAAREAIQRRGYNGFSFRDLAEEVGVKSASVHYHYPTKSALAQAVIQEYRDDFSDALATILRDYDSAVARLNAYAAVFQASLEADGRMCLCGMLASDRASLPDEASTAVEAFFSDQEEWISTVLEEGIESHELSLPSTPEVATRIILSLLEGGLLIERGRVRPRELTELLAGLLSSWVR